MRKLFLVLLVICFLSMVSCAGRDPVLVDINRDTDSTMTCDQINTEITQNESEIMEKYYIGKKKTSETVGAAVAGYFVIIPFFFMDLKKAEYKEMGALQERRNHIIQLSKNNNCEGCNDYRSDDQLMADGQKEYEEKMAEKRRINKMSNFNH